MPIKFLNSGLLEGSLQLTSYGGGSISGTGTYNLGVDASGNVIETSLIEGSGTTNYVVKWTPDGNTLGDSQIFDNGTNVGVGTNQPDYKLDVDGQIRSTSSSFPVYFLQRETSITGDGTFTSTNGIASGFHLRTNSSGTIQNGFGGGIVFSLTDSGTASNTAARIYARRDGSDTTAALQFWGGLDGTTILSTMRADGSVYFDEYGSGTFTGTAVKNLSITSSGKIIETDAVPANVVETVTTTDGTYINLTPNSPTDGAVTVTADLSAVDGTSGANERYLTKTNKWAEISTIPGTYTWSVDGDQGVPITVNSGNTVDFAGSTYITTSTLSGPTLVITHDTTARNNLTSSITPNFGSSFTAIDSITTNSTGHVTAVNTKTVGLGTPVWFADADTGSEDIENGTTVTFVGGTGMDTSINSNFEITFTNTDRGSSQNIFKNFAVSGQSTVVADSNNDTLTLVAGSNVSLTTNATNDSITINATDTNTNNYVSSISFNTTNGVLTLNRSGLSSLTVDLDGRYLTGNQSISLTGDVTGSGTTSIATNVSADVIGASELKVTGNGTTSQFLRSDGDGTFSWATPTDTNTNNYVTSASFNTGNGVLTLNRSGLSAVTVDLDGRYLTSYTETDTLATVVARGSSTTSRITTGGLTTTSDIRGSGQQLVLNAGESYNYATGQTAEHVYLNAEGGVHIVSSPDNWSSGWAGRRTAVINDSSGNSSLPGNLTVDAGDSTTLSVKCNNSGVALVRANGDDQGTGALEVGQSDSYGGGVSYNGDGSPPFVNGETADNITFYRMSAGTRTEVFSYPYSGNTVTFNGDITVNGSGSGILVDTGGHASLRLDRASTSYDNNVLFMTAGGIKWRLWQDGTDNQLMIRDDANSYNSVVFNAGGASGYTTFNNPIRIGGTGTANELDDYEEGSWTASFGYAASGSVTNYAVSSFGSYTWTGKYVKIGRLVHCTYYFGCTTFPWPVNTISQVFINESSFPFAMESTTKAVNGSFYSFPGLSSSGTSSAEVTGTIYPIAYANNFGAAFVADRGYYSNFESADTDAFNAGPGTPSFWMRGSFQYYTDS